MKPKQVLILYPDHKKYVTCSERDDMLLNEEIKQVASNVFKFVGEVLTLHTMADLSRLLPGHERNPARKTLPGSFKVQYPQRLGGNVVHEILETPEAMALRLKRQPAHVG